MRCFPVLKSFAVLLAVLSISASQIAAADTFAGRSPSANATATAGNNPADTSGEDQENFQEDDVGLALEWNITMVKSATAFGGISNCLSNQHTVLGNTIQNLR